MITTLNRPDELRGHIRGALNNGATQEKTMEVFHHASGYCGLPAANGSVCIGVEVFRKLGLLDAKPVSE
ncbi:MAG: carboxymuconolactone decarboxylase family protein [Pseudomonadota bacterium]